jgi:hypothetical protein
MDSVNDKADSQFNQGNDREQDGCFPDALLEFRIFVVLVKGYFRGNELLFHFN